MRPFLSTLQDMYENSIKKDKNVLELVEKEFGTIQLRMAKGNVSKTLLETTVMDISICKNLLFILH